ncbi:MAG: hypothetical protein MUF73_00530 [Rhodobacteraceae bacterium]|jgi:hypothetical protein|nr:hypothetical protein [Paracoccaceae bacterium]
MAVTWDVVFVGRPSHPVQARRWQVEVDLVLGSGRQVLVVSADADMPNRLDAGLILVADGGLAARIGDVAADAQIVVRRAGDGTPALVRDLSDRLDRRVIAAPLGPAERAAWASHGLSARWMTAEDWPPLVDGAVLAGAAQRLAGEKRLAGAPWRVGMAGGQMAGGQVAGLAPADLAAALAAAGLGPDAVTVLAGPPDARRPPHVLLGGADPDPDVVAAALEAGCVVAVAAGPETDLADPVTPLDWDAIPQALGDVLASPGRWRDAFLRQAQRALDTRTDSPFLARLDDGTCGPALRPQRAPGRSTRTVADGAGPVPDRASRPPGCAAFTADVALIADFRRRDEVICQAAAQVRAHAACGRRVVLVQTWDGPSGGSVHPVIDALVNLGLARVVPPVVRARVACAQVLLPRVTIPALGTLRPAIEADRWVVTETESPAPLWDVAAAHIALARLYGTEPQWRASHPAAQRALSARLPGPVGAWPLPAPPPGGATDPGSRRGPVGPAHRSVVGIVAYAPRDAAAGVEALGVRALGVPPGAEVHVMLAGHERSLGGGLADHVRVLGLDGQDIDGFVRLIDVLVVPPSVPYDALPRLAVGLALARGVTVLAQPSLAPVLGDGPVYARPADWPARIADILRTPGWVARDPDALPPDDSRLALALGLRRAARPPAASAGPRPRPRVLFVTANGVGLGHVTRLSAIARRLPEGIDPVFATMSQAVGVLKDMGFAAELLTSYAGKPAEAWRASLFRRMTELLDIHRPASVVLDASNPYPGLVEAAICRPGMRLIWVRRGMWRASQDHSEFLTRAPYFERVIEPQDIAEAGDPAVQDLSAHGRVVRVPPIGLLDEGDLLDRGAARLALGLSETPPPGGSVLVQLGSGTTRDLNGLLGDLFARLRPFPGLEIVLAQWLNAPTAYDARWPGVRLLSGYPIPRYYRAFDFTISAAGYNSYNDLLRFGIPTIFIANDAQVMDDQGARARFAEQAEAAFNVPEDDLGPLADCVAAILQPQVRAFLQDRARSIALPNGAAAAAHTVAELA